MTHNYDNKTEDLISPCKTSECLGENSLLDLNASGVPRSFMSEIPPLEDPKQSPSIAELENPKLGERILPYELQPEILSFETTVSDKSEIDRVEKEIPKLCKESSQLLTPNRKQLERVTSWALTQNSRLR